MKPILLILFLGYSLFANAQETGKPVDFANPRVGDYLMLEPIFLYDLDKTSRIFPDYHHILQDAVELLKRLPDWKFQLESHTDCRAGYAFNDSLSQMRADTLLNYVLAMGFPSWRITAKGIGERMLLMEKCSCDLTDYNNRICEEKEHQLNRRTIIRLVRKIPQDHGMPINVKFPSVGQRKGYLISLGTLDSVCKQIRMTLDSIPSATYSITIISPDGRVKRRRLKRELAKRVPYDNVDWRFRVMICEFGDVPQDRVVVQILSL
ncbi:MAG: OmpA family protein [Bacteroidia bacterium]